MIIFTYVQASIPFLFVFFSYMYEQNRLNAWVRWTVAQGGTRMREGGDPMLIYVCCVRHVF